MIELGKIQLLVVQREKEFGVYLGEKKEDKNSVLLPKKQVPEGTKVGDSLEVFVYKDSQDRLIATTNRPKLQVGETAVLTVKDVAKIGAFLDICCFRLRSRIIRCVREKTAWWLFMWTRVRDWLLP